MIIDSIFSSNRAPVNIKDLNLQHLLSIVFKRIACSLFGDLDYTGNAFLLTEFLENFFPKTSIYSQCGFSEKSIYFRISPRPTGEVAATSRHYAENNFTLERFRCILSLLNIILPTNLRGDPKIVSDFKRKQRKPILE